MLHIPRRRLLLGAGAFAAYAALSKEARPFWQSRDSNYDLSIGGAPTSSAWDQAATGTAITISTTTVANDTASSTSSTIDVVRGTATKTTGKWAFELLLIAAGGIEIGLNDQATPGGAGMSGVLSLPNGLWQFSGGNAFASGTDFAGTGVASWTPANGDIMGCQADLTAGKVWFSLNGVSLAGNPVAGTGNLYTIANNHLVCPSAGLGTGVVAKLVTGTLTNPVTGYTAWG